MSDNSQLGTTDDTTATLAAVEAAIFGRRSIKLFKAQPVPRELIERLIEAAVWAPNHRLTEPWRFYVLDGVSRERLGEIAGRITEQKLLTSGAQPEIVLRNAAEAAATWARVPALVYVTVLRDANPEIDEENYGATCCAIQNLMLVAQAAGLGTSWSSGAVAAAGELKTLAGAGEGERMAGLLRVGYPDTGVPVPQSRRAPGAGFTTWLDPDRG